ncbi:MAG TPA: hypothetical protein VNW94_00925, partial [Streptosporangiaceae bacterium]|nr:hypothetical protein [Streptosporangiaceae bacterium]
RTTPQLTERPDGAVLRPPPPQRENGEVDRAALLTGCPFRLRCPEVMTICAKEDPRLRPWQPDHDVACHLHGSVAPEGEPA